MVKAFTLSKMEDVLYVEQPHGFEVPGKVCRLNQALEGTKQAAHLWQKNLSDFLLTVDLTRSTIDPCLYTSADKSIIASRCRFPREPPVQIDEQPVERGV